MSDEFALIFGGPGKAGGELQPLSAPRALTGHADAWPPLTAISGGTVAGTVSLLPDMHPNGLAGRTARVIVHAAKNAPADWLQALFERLPTLARQAFNISSLVVSPIGDGAVTPALKAAGFAAAGDHHVLDMVSPFWRKGEVMVIAEAGSNWRMGDRARDIAMAKALIDAAAETGADVVKFQTFRPETLYAPNAGSSDYLSESGITEDMDSIFADMQMPYDMLPMLADYARAAGIGFMSTAFSAQDFEIVEPLVDVVKVASYEITHIRLIELAARSGKPTVMSTGAANLDDIAWAVDHYHRNGGRDLCLMQCTAKYPAPMDSLNLQVIPELTRSFGVAAGLSDHSREAVAGPLAAVALGAAAIEKHFTLDNRLPGPDHAFAVTVSELTEMVKAVRAATAARGTGVKAVHQAEDELARFAQRGLQAITDIKVGDAFAEDVNFAVLRPGNQPKGAHPRHADIMAGRKATRALNIGEGVQTGDWD